MKEKVVVIIQNAVEEVNSTLADPVELDFKEEITLFGENGIFDSIALVTLILNIEEALQDQLNVSVLLANEKAMSQKNSPFKSVENLSQYVLKMLAEEGVSC